jgi:RNA polymerase sigma-70 factor (ECF subfamily)
VGSWQANDQQDFQWQQNFANQVRQHARLWFRLAYNVLRDAHAAEDACQAALTRGWSERERLRDPKLLKAWMARTVINESLQVLRRRKTERRAFENVKQIAPTSSDGPLDPLATRDSAVAALESLPETTRAVVALRIMQGLSGNDVKDLLGCSASQVSRMLHDGLEQLRLSMNHQGAQSKEDACHDMH